MKLKFYLVKGRPVIDLIINKETVRCLIDTGASVPVWYGKSALANCVFSINTHVIASDVKLKGVGECKCTLLKTNLSLLGMTIKNACICVPEKDNIEREYDMIIPFTFLMFMYKIDINIRQCEIEFILCRENTIFEYNIKQYLAYVIDDSIDVCCPKCGSRVTSLGTCTNINCDFIL